MREHQVDRERDAASGEAAVAAGLLAPANRERVVGPLRARAHGLRDLAGERRRLVHQRVAHLRARKHALQGPAEGLALHEAVGELLRLRALERIRDHPLQRGALQHPAGKLAELLLVERWSRLRGLRGDCLRDDALDDAVLDDRASDRLRQRAGHDAVDRALGLVRQRVPALTRDRARRPERKAFRRGACLVEQPAQQAGVVLLVLAGRRRRLVRHCSPPGSARGAQPTWPPPTSPGAAAPRAARDPTAARSAPSCRATCS